MTRIASLTPRTVYDTTPTRRLAVLLAVVVAVVGTILTVTIWVTATDPRPWNPLGDYPVQTVLNRVPGFDGPAVLYVGKDTRVDVVGMKCNATHEPVETAGIIRYRQLGPVRGFAETAAEGEGTLPPGCTTLTFANRLEPEVVTQALTFADPTTWIISGQDIPYRDDGDGVLRLIQSEPFLLVFPHQIG